jgi:hypothetical protein
VKLSYVEVVYLTTGLGSMGSYTFSLNSAFDPNTSGIGHQPMGYDQWSSFYNSYVVERCDYDVACLSSADAVLGVILTDDTTLPTGIEESVELGGVFALTTSGLPSHTFKGSVKIGDFFNRPSVATDSDLRAPIGSNPTNQAYVSVVQKAPASSEDLSVTYLVRLTYTVRFMEPKDLGLSLSTKLGTSAESPNQDTPSQEEDPGEPGKTPDETPVPGLIDSPAGTWIRVPPNIKYPVVTSSGLSRSA